MNIGEEICGEWLRHIKGCEFVEYNVKTTESQGEIDVLGLDRTKHVVYACEVAIHLTTGLQYVRDKRPDNIARLTAKLRRDILYMRSAFPDYEHVAMFWSPVVKNQAPGSAYNQSADVKQISAAVKAELGETVLPVINDEFDRKLRELRGVARRETKELNSSVMRYLQVEEYLAAHLARLRRDPD